MILLQSPCRYLLQVLFTRIQNLEKGTEIDCQWVEFDDVRYHIQATLKNPNILLLSLSLPTPPPETVFFGGLPQGAIEAIKAAYGVVLQILDPPRDGFNLTLKLNFSKLPQNEDQKQALLFKIASIREVVLGAPFRAVLRQLALRGLKPESGKLISLVHRPNESFFVVPQADRVTVIFPMRFKDSVDTVLATSFLQEFVEARRTAGLSSAPTCLWSSSPPQELEGASAEALSTNAGFVTFVISPRHVEGKKLDRTVWSLSTFHAYVSYHVKAMMRYQDPSAVPCKRWRRLDSSIYSEQDWIDSNWKEIRFSAAMEKKIVVALSMILLIISANMDGVKPQGIGCYDACNTACVGLSDRLYRRCDRKCQIKCGPGLNTNGHFK